jgi:ferric-dicitrate binding protein FerR (iron transport regulator)
MYKEILIKYLNNNCSDEEFEKLVYWLKKEKENSGTKKWVLEDWKTFEPEISKADNKKYSALLDKIHHEINLKEKSNLKKINIRTFTRYLSHAAAILFLPLLGIFLYMNSNNKLQVSQYAQMATDSLEVIAPIGSRTVVQLTDGTVVNLNYGSRVKYPRVFIGDKREIELEGEGYFEVAHSPDKPFIVKTSKLNVTALGTEFNVQAYEDDDVIATTLVNGKVLVEKISASQSVVSLGIMVPGQHVEYNHQTDKVYSVQGRIEKYVAWKEGKLVFDNEPIEGVAEKLGRMFNVDFEVDETIKDYTYTATLENDPLFLVLDLMKEITDITYKAYPRKKLPDGTFTKQKIKLEKRQ